MKTIRGIWGLRKGKKIDCIYIIHDVDKFPYIAYRMTRNAVKNLSGMMPEMNSDEL